MSKVKISGNSTKSGRAKIYAAGMLVIFILSAVIYNFLPGRQPEEAQKSTENSMRTEKQLRFISADKNQITTIDVEIADNDEKRQMGLMFREKMDIKQGMLFIFPDLDMRSFWMKNTVLPLDIIYVDDKYEIVSIQKNAVPFSETSLPSLKPAKYVVEVNAGFTDQFKIGPGCFISFE